MRGVLRELGVFVALDDFGTGFSSLSNLKQYPITTLKMDKSFVKDLVHDPSDVAITRAVVAMGRNLDITVVEEGVESAQHAQLLQTRCDQAQGYYYARTVPAERFSEILAPIEGVEFEGETGGKRVRLTSTSFESRQYFRPAWAYNIFL